MSIAGCTNSNNNLSNTDSISSNNNSSNSQSNLNNNHLTTKLWSKRTLPYVVDGDTIDVDGVGRIRFVGVNTPERG